MIRRLLIANRGEIARRIMRTCRQVGVESIAIYSDVDAGAAHVKDADAAERVGPAPASQSYLNIANVIDAAKRSGADAIHPGYGFLSENAGFAEACAQATAKITPFYFLPAKAFFTASTVLVAADLIFPAA